MAQHLKQSESELNELLTEYWKLRHEAGRCILVTTWGDSHVTLLDLYMEIMSNKLTDSC